MKVGVHPADGGGCGAYRMLWPAQALAAQGHDVHVDTPAIRTVFTERFAGPLPPPWVDLVDADVDADVVVIQRPMHRQWLAAVPMLQEKGIRVVVELDDDFDHIDRANAAHYSAEPDWLSEAEVAEWAQHHGKPPKIMRTLKPARTHITWHQCRGVTSQSNRHNLRAVVALADHVVVSTPALAAHYGRHARSISVVRNGIPARYLDVGRSHVDHPRAVVVGWTGGLASHPRDLLAVGNALTRVRRPFHLRIIGPGDGVAEQLGRRVDSVSGWVPLESYKYAYGQLTVALCPLEDTPFNRAKSFLKAIEAAALGVVPIMSPLPEYLALHDMGVGLIARNTNEWRDHVDALVGSPIMRQTMRRRGLEVAATLTIEGRAEEWLAAWTGQPVGTAEVRQEVSA